MGTACVEWMSQERSDQRIIGFDRPKREMRDLIRDPPTENLGRDARNIDSGISTPGYRLEDDDCDQRSEDRPCAEADCRTNGDSPCGYEILMGLVKSDRLRELVDRATGPHDLDPSDAIVERASTGDGTLALSRGFAS